MIIVYYYPNSILKFILAASVTGGTYTSVTEQKIDDELEVARQARDKLGGVAEQVICERNCTRKARLNHRKLV